MTKFSFLSQVTLALLLTYCWYKRKELAWCGYSAAVCRNWGESFKLGLSGDLSKTLQITIPASNIEYRIHWLNKLPCTPHLPHPSFIAPLIYRTPHLPHFPGAMNMFVELGMFEIATFLSQFDGQEVLATVVVLFQFVCCFYTVPVGISTATTILIGK